MATKSKTHLLVIRTQFDKPVSASDAARLAKDILVSDYYPYGGLNSPGQMDVTIVRSLGRKEQ
jgi:hypothetical protein